MLIYPDFLLAWAPFQIKWVELSCCLSVKRVSYIYSKSNERLNYVMKRHL